MTLEEEIARVCLKIAKRGEGALIILGECDYEKEDNMVVKPFKIEKNPVLLESLALSGNAVIVNKEGMLIAYNVKIKLKLFFDRFRGRNRTSAAINASSNDGTIAYLVSAEERKVKIFMGGKLTMQLDPYEKGIENNIGNITSFIESIGFGTISSVGASLIIPQSIGIAIVPGIIIFGSGYYLINKIKERMKGLS